MNYFDKLPTITYDGQVAKNLLSRAKLSDRTKNNRMIYYPYTLEEGDRVDQVSQNYYDDPGYSWLIWFANDTVDPYYDMPLSDEDLYSLIVAKYGSFEKANRMIKHYRVRWAEDDTTLTPAQFESLHGPWKKYFEPVVNGNYVVQYYKRKPDDTVVETNRIMSVTLTNVQGTFEVGEEAQVSGTNYATVANVNGTAMQLKHIVGNVGQSSVITGQTSGATATISVVVNTVDTIAYTDAVYWSPVTFFDYEHEQNEKKKEIVLIDTRYKDQVESDLKRVMGII